MKYKINKKTASILVICAIVSSIFVEVLYMFHNPLSNNKIVGEVHELTNIHSVANQLDINESKYTTRGTDAFCVYSLDQSTVGSIIIEFGEPISKDMNLQIFYADSATFSETNSVKRKIRKGLEKAYINIPLNAYSKIRIDFGDISDFSFEIDSIYRSDHNEKEFRYMLQKDFVIRLLVNFIIFYLILSLLSLIVNTYLKKIILILSSESFVIDIIFLISLTMVFFSVMTSFSFDSFWYHIYLDIFEGRKAITAWDPTRGPIFPALIYLSSCLFGYTTQGITILSYIFYLLSILFSHKIMKYVFPKCKKIIRWIILTSLVLVNPIFLGYYHLILTEFVISTFCIIYFYCLIKTHMLLKCDNDQRIYFVRGIITLVFGVLCYFTKQMYILIIIIPFIGSEIMLLVQKYSWKRVSYTFGCGAFTIACVISLNGIWNHIIDAKNGKDILGREFSISNTMENGLLNGLRYFDIEVTPESETTINVVNEKGETTKSFTTSHRDGTVKTFFSCILKAPLSVLKGYIDNYLVIGNVYHFKDSIADIAHQEIVKEFNLHYGRENYYLACGPNLLIQRGNLIYNGQYDDVLDVTDSKQYMQYYDSNMIIKSIFNSFYIAIANFFYSFVVLIAGGLIILFVVLRCRAKKYKDLYEIGFMMSFALFFYIMALASLGCNIDRYAFPLYFLCVFLLIILAYIIYSVIHRLFIMYKLKISRFYD